MLFACEVVDTIPIRARGFFDHLLAAFHEDICRDVRSLAFDSLELRHGFVELTFSERDKEERRREEGERYISTVAL